MDQLVFNRLQLNKDLRPSTSTIDKRLTWKNLIFKRKNTFYEKLNVLFNLCRTISDKVNLFLKFKIVNLSLENSFLNTKNIILQPKQLKF